MLTQVIGQQFAPLNDQEGTTMSTLLQRASYPSFLVGRLEGPVQDCSASPEWLIAPGT